MIEENSKIKEKTPGDRDLLGIEGLQVRVQFSIENQDLRMLVSNNLHVLMGLVMLPGI